MTAPYEHTARRLVRQQAWDDALLALIVERPGLAGDVLLAAVIEEATDALSRLKEHGLVNAPSDEEES